MTHTSQNPVNTKIPTAQTHFVLLEDAAVTGHALELLELDDAVLGAPAHHLLLEVQPHLGDRLAHVGLAERCPDDLFPQCVHTLQHKKC